GQVVELDALAVLPGLLKGEQRAALPVLVLLAQPRLLLAVGGGERGGALLVEEGGDDADDAGGVQHVHGRRPVGGRDLHGGVLPGRGGPADQQRQPHAAPLHLGGDRDHLVQRRRDQPGQPDRVGVLLDRRVEDLGGGDHDAEVHDVVVVAAEDDADDVLADVVDVALHGRED